MSCDFCPADDAAEATLYCGRCSTKLCKSCSSSLHSRRAFSTHEVITLAAAIADGIVEAEAVIEAEADDGVERCAEHHQVVTHWCATCLQATCSLCKRYGEHGEHFIQPLDKVQRQHERVAERMRTAEGKEQLVKASRDAAAGCVEEARQQLETVRAMLQWLRDAEHVERLSSRERADFDCEGDKLLQETRLLMRQLLSTHRSDKGKRTADSEVRSMAALPKAARALFAALGVEAAK
eukprot:PLAT6272.1.p1 GENE.PLAT6272.1~~PLAT6272.1.p1  ORF type:complete len:268 (-),score=87.89 PLAT6272.1:82-792(-)